MACDSVLEGINFHYKTGIKLATLFLYKEAETLYKHEDACPYHPMTAARIVPSVLQLEDATLTSMSPALVFQRKSWRQREAGWFVQPEEAAEIMPRLELSVWFSF